MSSVGSFGTFTTARLAIYVSQKGLSVTGNNIGNINTIGYTRQRLDQVSFKTGMADRYQNPFDTHVGNGAIARSVSQLRDPYLDIRYRTEHSSEGFHLGKLDGLDQIASILDEIGKGPNDGDGLLYAQFSDFFKALQQIQVGAGTEVNDTLASTSAETLCKLFYDAANRLQTLQKNTEDQLRLEVNDINSLLINIRNLNESIRKAEIYGDPALELRDARNNLIDELSEKVKIEATYTMEDVGGKEVEKLTIRLGNANPNKDVTSDSSILVDGNYCAQLTTPKENLDANGNSLYIPEYAIFDKNSAAYAEAVKKLSKDPAEEVANPDVKDAVFKTKEELDKYIDTFMTQSTNKLAPFQFLDKNGEGTNDPRVADQVFDDHYNITVSDLRDKNNEPWVHYPDVRDTFVKVGLNNFPTKAEYSGQFSFSGVWKDGDKIEVNGGQKVVIGAAANPPDANTIYLSADAANSDPKNVSNAIRKALLASGQFKGYEITTQTTREKLADGTEKFNVKFNVKAQDPGKKDTALPGITITADTTANTPGSVNIGAPTQVPDSKPAKYTVSITAGNKFNKGDKITFGPAPNDFTLEVGKDLSVNAANDPARLAAKLAGKIKMDGYTVSSTVDKDGNASLVFKAAADNTPTPVQLTAKAVAADPVVFNKLDDPNGTGWTDGKAGTIPNDPPKIVDNGDNTTSKVITSYYMDDNDKWHEVVKTITTSNTKMLDDNDLFGRLQAVRELLTEEGEFSSQKDIGIDENAAIKRGIPYYREALDLLARQFAETMNEANTGFAVDENGNYLISTDGGKTFEKLPPLAGDPLNKTTGLTEDQKKAVEADALGNYVKANFAGFVKDADGKPTNVLADKYGNPLKLGGMTLTTENISIGGDTLKDLDFAEIDANGNMVDSKGAVIDVDNTDLANPVKKTISFTDAVPEVVTNDLNKQALESYLAVNGGYRMGGNLFSNRGDTDDDTGITALNISVSHSWNKGDVHVVPTYIKLFYGEGSNTTQNDNALHMGGLLNKDLIFNPQELNEDAVSSYLFNGSFQEMLAKMSTTLGEDQNMTKISLQTHMGQALDIDTSRDSVSAVDLNDEAMNLMQYTHSLNAAYRLMTTLDDMIERLITGTGVTR